MPGAMALSRPFLEGAARTARALWEAVTPSPSLASTSPPRSSRSARSPRSEAPAGGESRGERSAQREGEGSRAEERLALLEALLGTGDPGTCVGHAVAWLEEQAGVRQVVCALVDPAGQRLTAVASRGVARDVVDALALDLDRSEHPVVAALAAETPQWVDLEGGPTRSRAEAQFLAHPLVGHGPGGRVPVGVLLTGLLEAPAERDVQWLLGVLLRKLTVGGATGAMLIETAAVSPAGSATSAASAASAGGDVQAPRESCEGREAGAELSRQREMLSQQRVALEEAAGMKMQFLAGMSHQIRTPLNAVLGYTSMLLQGLGGGLSERQRGMLMRVDENARALLSTVNDVLDVSRMEAGKMPVFVGEVRIEEIVEGVLDELGPAIARSRLAVRTEVAAELPAVRTDRAKVKHILLNLITNALKYTREGSVTLRAAFEAQTREVVLSVVDTGIGIPEEQRGALFEDFQQVDNAVNRKQGGAGMGLPISQRLAALLGGRVEVSSAQSAGTTVTLRLPLDVADAARG
ncbi:Hypothetical protein CAP_1431 [Chondromyces apiculatus DSM 436]|uniref:histidine kinase n=1 Tax=Chondromyces apiculatus DSM 436 TaxID=1192034 RepID=A0A017TBW1_9BACT|nr:Hypothetical protein CAP_1431 [Chondromyces apiculatus DSM 436]